MFETIKDFLAKNAKVGITLALAGFGAVTLAYNKGCSASYSPEPVVSAPASPTP